MHNRAFFIFYIVQSMTKTQVQPHHLLYGSNDLRCGDASVLHEQPLATLALRGTGEKRNPTGARAVVKI